MKKIFIICSVRWAPNEYRVKLENYAKKLESDGKLVHLPHRDTNQNAKEIDICRKNMSAISACDEVHVFYDSKSQGIHFDMGVAFALKKTIKVIENEKYEEGKSYSRMLDQWQSSM